MTENTESFNIKSLDGKGALWTIAGTGIASVASQLLGKGGGLGGLFGCNNCGANNALAMELAKKDSEIALLKADNYTDQKMVDVYTELRKQDKTQDAVINALASRVAAIETASPLREQLVLCKVNEVASLAQNGICNLTTQITSLANTVANITKCVVPMSAICPQPMPQYNAWVAPTGPTA